MLQTLTNLSKHNILRNVIIGHRFWNNWIVVSKCNILSLCVTNLADSLEIYIIYKKKQFYKHTNIQYLVNFTITFAINNSKTKVSISLRDSTSPQNLAACGIIKWGDRPVALSVTLTELTASPVADTVLLAKFYCTAGSKILRLLYCKLFVQNEAISIVMLKTRHH